MFIFLLFRLSLLCWSGVVLLFRVISFIVRVGNFLFCFLLYSATNNRGELVSSCLHWFTEKTNHYTQYFISKHIFVHLIYPSVGIFCDFYQLSFLSCGQ